jgi:hypothetical protein
MKRFLLFLGLVPCLAFGQFTGVQIGSVAAAGTGNVSGPASATANDVPTFSSATGIQDTDLTYSSGTLARKSGVLSFTGGVSITGGLTLVGNNTLSNGGNITTSGGVFYTTLNGSAAAPQYTNVSGATAGGVYFPTSSTIALSANGSRGFSLDSSDNGQFAAKVSQFNNVSTAGFGVPAIYAAGRATAQVAANASVSTYTNGAADGSFEVSANVLVTTSTLHTFTVTCAYTDEGNTSRVVTLSFSNLAGTFLTSIANAAGAVPYEGVPIHIRCKASTAITIATVGTFTTVTYNVEGIIRQLN